MSLDKVESIAQAAAGITDDHDEEYAAYMASPQKREQARAAKERADQIAATLREEAARLAKDKAVTADVDEERVFWRSPQPIRLWMPPSHTQSAWLDRFELAIDGERTRPLQTARGNRLCAEASPCWQLAESLPLTFHPPTVCAPSLRIMAARPIDM